MNDESTGQSGVPESWHEAWAVLDTKLDIAIFWLKTSAGAVGTAILLVGSAAWYLHNKDISIMETVTSLSLRVTELDGKGKNHHMVCHEKTMVFPP